MTAKTTHVKGRPISNRIDRIPVDPKDIAKALFKAADKKINKSEKIKKKPN